MAIGLVAEWRLFGWAAPRSWIPDLLTGWTLLGCGLVAWSRRPESRSGHLLVAAGVAWFVPNLGAGTWGWLATYGLYLHRGALIQLVLTYPSGRSHGRLDRAAVITGWVMALAAPVWRSQAWTIAAATLLAGYAYVRYAGSVGVERRSRRIAARATIALAAVIAATAAIRLTVKTPAGQEATLLGYETALCILAVALLVGLLRRPADASVVTDLVVDLGGYRSPVLRDELARALGDPTLAVGFWVPESHEYVDATGRPVELPLAGDMRRITRVEWNGEPIAELVHDPSVVDDPLLLQAVATAARFAASNARLHAEARSRMSEVAASRRRLLTAADEERGRLEAQLSQGPARQLSDVLEALQRTDHGKRAREGTIMRVERARLQLALAVDELLELAAGLHPRVVTDQGLALALRSLSKRSPVPVRVEIAASSSLSEEVEVAAYFLCSEALTNVTKYAGPANVLITVAATGSQLEIVITDDGFGGAQLMGGSGLRGLQDRIEALGGTFSLESPLGRGTTVRAVLPLRSSVQADGAPRRNDG